MINDTWQTAVALFATGTTFITLLALRINHQEAIHKEAEERRAKAWLEAYRMGQEDRWIDFKANYYAFNAKQNRTDFLDTTGVGYKPSLVSGRRSYRGVL